MKNGKTSQDTIKSEKTFKQELEAKATKLKLEYDVLSWDYEFSKAAFRGDEERMQYVALKLIAAMEKMPEVKTVNKVK